MAGAGGSLWCRALARAWGGSLRLAVTSEGSALQGYLGETCQGSQQGQQGESPG